MIVLAGLGEGLDPFGVVHRVGIELGLQRNAAPVAVGYAVLARALQIIAGVEVETGAIGGDGHGAAGFGIRQNGAGVGDY